MSFSVTEAVQNIRNLIGDTATPPVYDDEKIREYLFGAGLPRTNIELSTAFVSEDLATIDPEPTQVEQYVIELCSAYAIIIRQFTENAGKAIRAKEGSSEIDLSNSSKESGSAAKALNALISEVVEKIKRGDITGVYIV